MSIVIVLIPREYYSEFTLEIKSAVLSEHANLNKMWRKRRELYNIALILFIADDTPKTAEAIIEIGISQLMMNNLNNAQKTFHRALNIYQESGNVEGLCETKMHLAAVMQRYLLGCLTWCCFLFHTKIKMILSTLFTSLFVKYSGVAKNWLNFLVSYIFKSLSVFCFFDWRLKD